MSRIIECAGRESSAKTTVSTRAKLAKVTMRLKRMIRRFLLARDRTQRDLLANGLKSATQRLSLSKDIAMDTNSARVVISRVHKASLRCPRPRSKLRCRPIHHGLICASAIRQVGSLRTVAQQVLPCHRYECSKPLTHPNGLYPNSQRNIQEADQSLSTS